MAMPKRSFLTRYRCQLHAVVLGTIPMALGVAGAVFDELTRLGFSTWRTACREAGATLVSLVNFTIQLMPTAVAGVLAGGLLVLIAGAIRHDRHGRSAALAAHGGCVAGIAAGLPLCVLPLPLPLVLGVETLLTAAGALILSALLQRWNGEAAVKPPARVLASAQ
jgi:hypothetical protein